MRWCRPDEVPGDAPTNAVRSGIATLLLVGLAWSGPVAAQSADELEKANQQFANPLAQATLWITENNTLIAGGDAVSGNRNNNVTIIDPLIPMSIGSGDWSLVHRPILPIWASLHTPDPPNGFESNKGIGDFTYFAAFSPAAIPVGETGKFIWGAGPIARFPTGGSDLGAEKYSAGAVFIGLYSSPNLTVGFLNQNLFSFAGESDRDSVQSSTFQYFYFYNFTPKWAIGAAPTLSFDWEDSDNNAIPLGIGIARSFFTGKTPNRFLVEIDWYADQNDDFGPKWNIRFAWARFLPRFFD